MRLIDADAMHKYVEDRFADGDDVWENFVGHEWAWALTVVDRQPTIDPEDLQPKGEWQEKLVHDPDFGDICFDQCSVCGGCQYTQSNYCPNCGADMRGAGHD